MRTGSRSPCLKAAILFHEQKIVLGERLFCTKDMFNSEKEEQDIVLKTIDSYARNCCNSSEYHDSPQVRASTSKFCHFLYAYLKIEYDQVGF